jgi:hypothetical protein
MREDEDDGILAVPPPTSTVCLSLYVYLYRTHFIFVPPSRPNPSLTIPPLSLSPLLLSPSPSLSLLPSQAITAVKKVVTKRGDYTEVDVKRYVQ